jgi:hypothetical protein
MKHYLEILANFFLFAMTKYVIQGFEADEVKEREVLR